MKTQTTRIPPRYGLISLILSSVLFWLGVIIILLKNRPDIKNCILETLNNF